jgi:hypothetical protein
MKAQDWFLDGDSRRKREREREKKREIVENELNGFVFLLS